MTYLPKTTKQALCQHEWQLYKKEIGLDKRYRRHTLIFRGCPKCKQKIAIDLKVTKSPLGTGNVS